MNTLSASNTIHLLERGLVGLRRRDSELEGGSCAPGHHLEVLLVQLQTAQIVRPFEGDQFRDRGQLGQVIVHSSFVVERQRRLDRVLIG